MTLSPKTTQTLAIVAVILSVGTGLYILNKMEKEKRDAANAKPGSGNPQTTADAVTGGAGSNTTAPAVQNT